MQATSSAELSSPLAQAAKQLEESLEAARREAAEASKLRAELATAVARAEEALQEKQRADELRLQVRKQSLLRFHALR